jgi:hypothetical protein
MNSGFHLAKMQQQHSKCIGCPPSSVLAAFSFQTYRMLKIGKWGTPITCIYFEFQKFALEIETNCSRPIGCTAVIVHFMHISTKIRHYVPCILYSTLFRTANAQHVYNNEFLYNSTATCFDAFALSSGSLIFCLLKLQNQ